METIPARVFDINADDPITALRMEREENEHRRDLTPSEKVELARRIEEALAGRHGSNQYQRKEEVQNFVPPLKDKPHDIAVENNVKPVPKPIITEPPEPPQGKSSDIAAKAVGMNRETYRQAKAVVDSGKQDVIQAMDTGEKSVSAAYNSVRDRNPQIAECKTQAISGVIWDGQ